MEQSRPNSIAGCMGILPSVQGGKVVCPTKKICVLDNLAAECLNSTSTEIQSTALQQIKDQNHHQVK